VLGGGHRAGEDVMLAVVPYIVQILQNLPGLIAAGEDAYAYVTAGNANVKAMIAANRGPTDAEWTALDASVTALSNELDS
jgi:hypothetical protein